MDGGGPLTHPTGWVQSMERGSDGSGESGLLLWVCGRCLCLVMEATGLPGCR